MKEVKDKLLTSEQCIEQLGGRAKVSYMHAQMWSSWGRHCVYYLYTFHTDFCFLRYELGFSSYTHLGIRFAVETGSHCDVSEMSVLCDRKRRRRGWS